MPHRSPGTRRDSPEQEVLTPSARFSLHTKTPRKQGTCKTPTERNYFDECWRCQISGKRCYEWQERNKFPIREKLDLLKWWCQWLHKTSLWVQFDFGGYERQSSLVAMYKPHTDYPSLMQTKLMSVMMIYQLNRLFCFYFCYNTVTTTKTLAIVLPVLTAHKSTWLWWAHCEAD